MSLTCIENNGSSCLSTTPTLSPFVDVRDLNPEIVYYVHVSINPRTKFPQLFFSLKRITGGVVSLDELLYAGDEFFSHLKSCKSKNPLRCIGEGKSCIGYCECQTCSHNSTSCYCNNCVCEFSFYLQDPIMVQGKKCLLPDNHLINELKTNTNCNLKLKQFYSLELERLKVQKQSTLLNFEYLSYERNKKIRLDQFNNRNSNPEYDEQQNVYNQLAEGKKSLLYPKPFVYKRSKGNWDFFSSKTNPKPKRFQDSSREMENCPRCVPICIPRCLPRCPHPPPPVYSQSTPPSRNPPQSCESPRSSIGSLLRRTFSVLMRDEMANSPPSSPVKRAKIADPVQCQESQRLESQRLESQQLNLIATKYPIPSQLVKLSKEFSIMTEEIMKEFETTGLDYSMLFRDRASEYLKKSQHISYFLLCVSGYLNRQKMPQSNISHIMSHLCLLPETIKLTICFLKDAEKTHETKNYINIDRENYKLWFSFTEFSTLIKVKRPLLDNIYLTHKQLKK